MSASPFFAKKGHAMKQSRLAGKRKRIILNPLGMLMIGFLLGMFSRWLDLYTTNLGNVFSQLAIWILFGVLISIYSRTKRAAMCNILPFCIGILLTYYGAAVLTEGVYSRTYIIGWTIFACCSPLFAYFAWSTKENGVFPKMISIGILLVSVLSSIILFDGFRFYDFIIDGVLLYFLFFKRISQRRSCNGTSSSHPQ